MYQHTTFRCPFCGKRTGDQYKHGNGGESCYDCLPTVTTDGLGIGLWYDIGIRRSDETDQCIIAQAEQLPGGRALVTEAADLDRDSEDYGQFMYEIAQDATDLLNEHAAPNWAWFGFDDNGMGFGLWPLPAECARTSMGF